MATSRELTAGSPNGGERGPVGARRGVVASSRAKKQASMEQAQQAEQADEDEPRRLRAELEAQVADMTRLHELTTRLVTSRELVPMLRDVLAAVMELQHAEMGTVMLCDAGRVELRPAASAGFSPGFLEKIAHLPLGVAPCGTAAAERRPVIVEDTETDPLMTPIRDAVNAGGFRAVYSTPLTTLDGNVLGAIATYFPVRHRPTEREMRLVEMYARQAAALVERAQLYDAEQQARRKADQQAREIATAFEAITDGVAVMDRDGHILRMNRAGRQQLGLDTLKERGGEFFAREAVKRAELVEMRDEHGAPIPPERLPQLRIVGGETLTGEQTVDVHVRMLDGRERVWNFGGAPIRNAAGAIIGGVAIFRDVTERQRLERAAAAERIRWRAVTESAPELVATCDAALRLTYLNPAYEWLRGATLAEVPEEASERPAAIGLYLPDGSALYATDDLPFQQAIRAGRPVHGIEVLHQTAHGTERLVSWDAAPMYAPDGELLGAVAIGRDITEQRQQERALREHAQRLEAIFAAVADGAIFYDETGRMVQWNAAATALFELDRMPGYTALPVEVRPAGLQVRDGNGHPIAAGDLPFMRAARGETLTGTHAVDLLVIVPSGVEKRVNVSAAPLRDDTGRTVGSIAVYRDVTARRHLERRTHETLDALLAMAEALVAREIGPDGEETEPAARVTARRLAELTRRVIGCQRVSITAIEPETEVLRPLAAVGLAPELEHIWYMEAEREQSLVKSMGAYPDLLAGLRAGQVEVIDLREARFQGAENPYAIKQLVIAPMRMGDRLVGLLALDYTDSDHDYTPEEIEVAAAVAKLGALVVERERLRQAREAATASALALREANRRMDEFLGVAAHELRTPLTSVRANVQLSERRLRALLGEQGRPDTDTDSGTGTDTIEAARLQPLQGMLARADRQTHLLERLVNDLVDVSRIQNNKLEMHQEPVNLTEIVLEAVREQRLAWPQRPIPVELPYEPATVVADAERIGQVVTNYLTNALKYSAEDRPVAVALSLEHGTARVTVRDEGPGLTPEQAERVWERFHRVPGIEVQSGSGVGLGLGLHISRTIVERHGGSVGVESEPGAGATFWFTLPVDTTGFNAEATTGFNTEDTEQL